MSGIMLLDLNFVFNLFGPCANEAGYAIGLVLFIETLLLIVLYLIIRFRRWYVYVRVNEHVYNNNSVYEMTTVPLLS